MTVDKSSTSLTLTGFQPDRKVAVIKAVMKLAGLNTQKAKDAVENLPYTLKRFQAGGAEAMAACDILSALRDHGATCEIVGPRATSTRRAKDVQPDTRLITSAADLLGFVGHVYDYADGQEIRNTVRTARDQVELWCRENEEPDLSAKLFEACGVLILIDLALEAGLTCQSSICDPIRASIDAAAGLLRSAARRPTEAS